MVLRKGLWPCVPMELLAMWKDCILYLCCLWRRFLIYSRCLSPFLPQWMLFQSTSYEGGIVTVIDNANIEKKLAKIRKIRSWAGCYVAQRWVFECGHARILTIFQRLQNALLKVFVWSMCKGIGALTNLQRPFFSKSGNVFINMRVILQGKLKFVIKMHVSMLRFTAYHSRSTGVLHNINDYMQNIDWMKQNSPQKILTIDKIKHFFPIYGFSNLFFKIENYHIWEKNLM